MSGSESNYSDDSDYADSGGCSAKASKKRKSIATRQKNDLKKKKIDVIILSSSDEDDNSEDVCLEDDYDDRDLLTRIRGRRKGGLKTTGLNEEIEPDDEPNNVQTISRTSSSTSSANSTASKTNEFTLDSFVPASCPRKLLPMEKLLPTKEDCNSYIQNLEKNAQKRKYSLSKLSSREVIATGRTIKSLKAWKGHWPPLREFLQNTVDHLSLMDEKTGRRRACLDMEVAKEGKNRGEISFTCQDTPICKFEVPNADEVIIEQNYTFPISSRAVDTGVDDTSKSSNSAQAGGFGDGFKTVATTLMANSKKGDFDSLKWDFYAIPEKTKLTWSFEPLEKEKVATFAKCQVLQVVIDKCKMNNDEVESFRKGVNSGYIMRQKIKVKNIGKFFLEQAVTKFMVFWDLDDRTLISTLSRRGGRGTSGDCIGPISEQPKLFNGTLGNLQPKSGIYVSGIFVRNAKITGTIMCFFGDRLEVNGRDRNDVNDEELVNAVSHVLTRCNNMEYLRSLLLPLLENKKDEKQKSWLLQPSTLFNRLIETQKEFILHDVLLVPRNAVFISDKTFSSEVPFFSWALHFLRKRGQPLICIKEGANKFLFEECNEYKLTEKCVNILKTTEKRRRKGGNNNQTGIRKCLAFLGLSSVKAMLFKDLEVPFIHKQDIYIPEAKLSRDMIIMVVNVCNSKFEGITENYSSLIQSIVEILPARKGYECNLEDVLKVVTRASQIKKDASNFLHCKISDDDDDDDDRIAQVKSVPKSTQVKTVPTSAQVAKTVPTSYADLVGKMETISDQARKRGSKLVGGMGFEAGNAGNDEHIRPSSKLVKFHVDQSYGGGSILCDQTTVDDIRNHSLSSTKRSKIRIIRNAMDEACNIIRRSIPSSTELLKVVFAGYDGNNDEYEAFCDGSQIVVNLFAYLPKVDENEPVSHTLVMDLVTTITHEVAHLLEPNAGHGPIWRDAHMKLIIQVMQNLK
uniref:Uncharacterized protein n=1 Tax=Chaetoceros debilis TaxID=122233 RepID=A0A6S8YFX9_9STRA|mmetsp:Transcript_22456/g.33240  ORF Transcript_22456/g.33240 Transcript_22456/m.33240 type:complete len:966 (+) Transcript_22456:119-3016(+)